MWMAVRERTREIGTLRAIGMSRRRVLGLFLCEGLLLGLAATVVGALVGAGLGLGLDALHVELSNEAARMILMSDTLHLRVSGGQVFGAVALLTVLTTLATLGPALRASRMRPITAIHHLG
jgi:ABC-type lipoprotein release transport system permease subunit